VSEILDGLRGIDLFGHSAPPVESSPSLIPFAEPQTFAKSLVELALAVKREGLTDQEHALAVITEGAVAIIDGAEHSAVVVKAGSARLEALSVYGCLPPLVMGLQNEVGEGPCLEALSQTSQVVVCDVRAETRWPLFSARVKGLGVGSMICTPLAVEDKVIGSLSLASSRPHAFDDEAAGLAAVFAAHATLALVGAEEVRNLTAMVCSRDVIGQAKGILMERLKLTNQEAFATLVRASQKHNIKLRVLSEQLIQTGVLPR
jgi:transcriptional regulator with GAF, ATPase, and Fis domain